MLRSSLRCLPALAVLAAVACGVSSEEVNSTAAVTTVAAAPPALDNDPSPTPVTQILDATTLTKYKSALPTVAYPRLAKILSAPSTLFWDKAVMPPIYQDTVGGQNLPIGARRNNEGKSLIVPPGKKLFSDDGSTWAFPFGHTAGMDDTTNIFIVNFMNLPAQNGKILPIAYDIEDRDTGDGLRLTRWNWTFPKGAIVGEIVMIRDAAGGFVTTEIRVRERFADRWSTNAYRPFPTATSLSTAIKTARPGWAQQANLAAIVAQLENNATLTPKTLSSPAFNNMVTLSGAEDAALPDFADDTLVKELLTKTPFASAYGAIWKQQGDTKAFGAHGGSARFGVVADNFAGGLLEVREATCEKCHNQGGAFIGDLVPDAILYGDVWGTDRIFSFTPFEPSLVQGAGEDNRQVRAAFTTGGIVERFDPAKHPATLYKSYTPQRSR